MILVFSFAPSLCSHTHPHVCELVAGDDQICQWIVSIFLKMCGAESSTAGNKELKQGRVRNEKRDIYNLASWESGGPPALHGRKTEWLFSARIFIGRSHMRSFSSLASSCPTLCDTMNCSTPGLPVHHQLLEFTQTHVHCVPSNNLILCLHLLLPPSTFPSIRVFSNESALHIRWP